MTDINQLSTATLVSSDLIPVWSTGNSDTRKATLAAVKAFINDGDTVSDDKVTQYAAPNATGFTATITDSSASVWLILTPGGSYAAGTIVLPSAANSVEKQEVLVNCTQSVASLSVTSSGGTVTGAPSSLSANGFFRMRFEPVTSTWYRVG